MVPAQRTWTVVLHGVSDADVEVPDTGIAVTADASAGRLVIELGTVETAVGASLRLVGMTPGGGASVQDRMFEILRTTQGDYTLKEHAWEAMSRPGDALEVLRRLEGLELPDPLRSALYEILLSER